MLQTHSPLWVSLCVHFILPVQMEGEASVMSECIHLVARYLLSTPQPMALPADTFVILGEFGTYVCPAETNAAVECGISHCATEDHPPKFAILPPVAMQQVPVIISKLGISLFLIFGWINNF